MVTATKLATCAIFVILCGLIAAAQQGKPDFSGKWVLDVARSGPEPVIWLQRRPVKFTIRQTDYASTRFFNDCRRSANESRKDGIQGQAHKRHVPCRRSKVYAQRTS